MADNVLIATANDANGAHQKVVNEYLDANGLPVSVSATNPLPVEAVISTAGLATSVGQTAGNTSLSSINGKLPTGLTVTANRLQVELPAGGSGLTNAEIRATPLPVSITGGGDATAVNQTTEIAKLTSIDGKIPALGQALATASTPVVLTAVQLSALTPTPAISGFATSAKQDLLLTELQLKADLTETQPVSVVTLPLPTGAATSANQQTDSLTNTQLRAAPIPVSITSDIQIGAVELKNATTDDRVAIINVVPTTEFGVVTRNIPSGTQAVSGTFFQTTQPVSLTSTTVTGSVAVTGALTDTQIRATALPISGSVSISNLNPAVETGLAKDATLTGGTQKSILRTAAKGTTTAGDTTSTNIDVNTQALDVSVKGGISVSNFPATQPISGTVTANTGLAQPLTNTEIRLTPLPISGTVSTGGLTDTQIRATPLPISGVVSANSTLSAETTKVIGTVNIAGTVPISGSVTSNIGTTNGLALDSTLTGGTQKSIARGGSKGTTVAADVTSTIIDVNTQALDVSIKGTVTTGGLTDTQIRATALPISGTVTANIGTTNGLALDTSVNTLLKPASTLAAVTSITNTVTIKADTPANQVNALKTDGSATTQPISAATLPLPSGASTATLQGTGNTSLGSIDTKLPTGLTVTANRLQVELPVGGSGLTNTELRATALPISAASLPLPTGAATETTLGALNTKIPSGLVVTTGRLQVELPAGGTGLTNTELRATAVPVSLTSTTITGSVAVTGGLTDTQIRATPLPVTMSNTLALTDTQLRAAPVTVTMSNTLALTDTQIRATALPVSGAFFQTTQPISNAAMADNTSTGTLAAAAETVVLPIGGKSAVGIVITGTWVGTITFEGTVDGVNWNAINAVAASTSTPQSTTVVNGLFRLTPAGLFQVRANMTAFTSGTATLTMRASTGTGGVFANQVVPVTLISNPAEGVVSVVNSTVINLAANAVFTGTAEDITVYSNIKVNVYSSHVSATDGLSYQQSHDGVLWIPADSYTIPALTQRSFSTSVNMRFFRVVYTNGATTTTQLVIQTLYHKSDKQPSSVRPQDGRGNDNDFSEALSFLMGYNSINNSWNRIGVMASNTNGNETLVDKLKVNATLRVLDTAQTVGSQLVPVTGTQALGINVNVRNSSNLSVTATAASGVAATLTIPAVVAQFHYITSLKMVLYSTAARVGVAAPIIVTTTNASGALAFTFDTAGAIGTNIIQEAIVSMPLRSSAVNTATTIVAPAVVGGIWRITATYFTGA